MRGGLGLVALSLGNYLHPRWQSGKYNGRSGREETATADGQIYRGRYCASTLPEPLQIRVPCLLRDIFSNETILVSGVSLTEGTDRSAMELCGKFTSLPATLRRIPGISAPLIKGLRHESRYTNEYSKYFAG